MVPTTSSRPRQGSGISAEWMTSADNQWFRNMTVNRYMAYFLGMGIASSTRHANEIYFEDICSIRAMRYRDRHGSGNVLGRMTLTHSDGSRAALPARRNSFTVPANGTATLSYRLDNGDR